MIRIRRTTDRRPRHRTRGQALVEFALVFPLFLLVALGLIEFAFVFNAVLATNFSSRAGALLAAEAGNGVGADCVILEGIDREITPPADANRVTGVDIYWANVNGTEKPGRRTTYVRDTANPTTCTFPGGATLTVPYRRTSNGYAEADRCNVVAGCPVDSVGAVHPALDTIGVRIGYNHVWKTPLDNFLRSGGTGFQFSRSNAMRMEPIL